MLSLTTLSSLDTHSMADSGKEKELEVERCAAVGKRLHQLSRLAMRVEIFIWTLLYLFLNHLLRNEWQDPKKLSKKCIVDVCI
jgi:hypothetical protein